MSVGCGELVGAQCVTRDPGERRAADGARFVSFPGALEELKLDRFFGITMSDRLDQLPNLDLDPKFLHQFAMQCLLKGLTWLAFASGEFPQAGEMPASGALGDEQFAVAEDQSGTDLNDFPW